MLLIHVGTKDIGRYDPKEISRDYRALIKGEEVRCAQVVFFSFLLAGTYAYWR